MNKNLPRLAIFAAGEKYNPELEQQGKPQSGGSGFEKLVEARDSGVLVAEIVVVVSNHEHGGVREKADRLGIPFVYFPKPWNAENYQRIVRESGAEWVALSGWIKLVKTRCVGGLFWWFWSLLSLIGLNKGLDPRKLFNIHPALLSQLNGRFGGKGKFGHHVHDAKKTALDAGEINESGPTMHFVTNEYDRGPAFFELAIPLVSSMTAYEIGKAVNQVEHVWQPRITNMVIHGEISWDGVNPNSLQVPKGYQYLPRTLN
jgi:folate-dependent phosphoribosylglycinamide formyltransferase PurN